MLLFSEGQTGETWEPFKCSVLVEIGEQRVKKVLRRLFAFKGCCERKRMNPLPTQFPCTWISTKFRLSASHRHPLSVPSRHLQRLTASFWREEVAQTQSVFQALCSHTWRGPSSTQTINKTRWRFGTHRCIAMFKTARHGAVPCVR